MFSDEVVRPSAPAAPGELVADDSIVMRLAHTFRERGRELFLVGGTVRDLALRREHVDLDFATDARPDETCSLVESLAQSVWLQGIEFGTVGARIEGLAVEITTFRTESYPPESRHPRVAFTSDIETDLSRRDFTVNAMAIRLPEWEHLDPFGGLHDLQTHRLTTPIGPEVSFRDDPLRMLRAFRFASQLDFRVDPAVLDAIAALKEALRTVSAERTRDELSKLVTGAAPGNALRLADETGLTELFLPELPALKLEQDPVHRHKDVFRHTLAVVERTDADLILRLAALLHDIGKPQTKQIGPEGVTFHHHEIVGAKLARARLQALRYPNEVADTVAELIRLHHRFHTYRLGWTDAAVRRYVRDAGPVLGPLNALVRADCTTRNPDKARRLATRMDELEERISTLARQEELSKIRPELDGVQIMAFLGVAEGPIVGDARRFLLDVRLEEGPIGEDEAYERLDAWARDRGIDPAGTRVAPKEKKS